MTDKKKVMGKWQWENQLAANGIVWIRDEAGLDSVGRPEKNDNKFK